MNGLNLCKSLNEPLNKHRLKIQKKFAIDGETL